MSKNVAIRTGVDIGIVLGMVILGIQLTTTGCRGKHQAGEPNGTSQAIVGRYHNQDDFKEYIDIKPDGMVFRREKSPLSGYSEAAGKWKVYGNELMLIGPLGDTTKAQIKDRTILADGKTWVGEAKPEGLKDRVPGKYDVEFIIAGEVRKTDAYGVLAENGSASLYTNGQLTDPGTWKIEGGLIQVYGQDRKKKLIDGRAYGNFIVFAPDEQGAIARLAKQIPQERLPDKPSQPTSSVVKGADSGGDWIADSQTIWVKCMKCSQGYEMGERQYYKELEEMAKANPQPIPVAMPLKCQKCSQNAVRKAFKCEKCGEVFFANSVPADFEDRCPKCKHSATEAKRKARLGQQ